MMMKTVLELLQNQLWGDFCLGKTHYPSVMVSCLLSLQSSFVKKLLVKIIPLWVLWLGNILR